MGPIPVHVSSSGPTCRCSASQWSAGPESEYTTGGATARWTRCRRTEADDVVLRAEVSVSRIACGSSSRRGSCRRRRLAPPAFRLGVRPAVQDRDPGGAGGVHLHRGAGAIAWALSPSSFTTRSSSSSATLVMTNDPRANSCRRFERVLGDLDVGVLQRVSQRDEPVVRVVIDRERVPSAEHAARRRKLALDRLSPRRALSCP